MLANHDPERKSFDPPDVIATRIRVAFAKLAERLGPGLADELAEVRDLLLAIHSRVLYTEAALHHIAQLIGLDLCGLPDPFDRWGESA